MENSGCRARIASSHAFTEAHTSFLSDDVFGTQEAMTISRALLASEAWRSNDLPHAGAIASIWSLRIGRYSDVVRAV